MHIKSLLGLKVSMVVIYNKTFLIHAEVKHGLIVSKFPPDHGYLSLNHAELCPSLSSTVLCTLGYYRLRSYRIMLLQGP